MNANKQVQRSPPSTGDETPLAETTSEIPIPTRYRSAVNRLTWGKWHDFRPGPGPNGEAPDGKEASSMVLFLMEIYSRDNTMKGRNLWRTFCNDFEEWDVQTFNATSRALISDFRDHLVSHGVYMATNNRPISERLVNVIQQEDYHVWTDEEMTKASEKYPVFLAATPAQLRLGVGVTSLFISLFRA